MDAQVFGFYSLFLVSFALQMVAMLVRHIFVSVCFSFLHSLLISLILIAMGQIWLGIANLWFYGGLSYLALLKTSLLVGIQKSHKSRRRISISLLTFILIVCAFTASIGLLMPDLSGFKESSVLPATPLELGISQFGLIALMLALMALAALVSLYVLLRRDDVIEQL